MDFVTIYMWNRTIEMPPYKGPYYMPQIHETRVTDTKYYQSYSQVLANGICKLKVPVWQNQTGQAYAYFFAKLVLHNGVPEDAQRNQRDTVVLDASSTGTRSKGRLSSQSLNSFRCGGLVMTSGPILLALNPI